MVPTIVIPIRARDPRAAPKERFWPVMSRIAVHRASLGSGGEKLHSLMRRGRHGTSVRNGR